ncbi:helix-turn-helix domain-containing protein [Lysinibacillus agricola]|uniref:helix-turn-helix domain-containing protein n=1 Tax=Lysinibacillus agricola TaxID=2590012 RepID=UPI003C13F156
MNIHQALTIRMIQLAEERDKTVTEIARKGGIRQSTVSEIMNGRSKHPKVSTVQAYCNGCGITLSEFFDNPLFR